MRKFIVVGVIATLGATLLAVPASASFDHHFTVISKETSFRDTPNGFRFKDKLFNPRNRSDRVGRDRGECEFRRRGRRVRCHAVIHLNGDIGGFGNIKVRGGFTRNDNRLEVVGGTDDFNGVAGKMLLHERGRKVDKLHFDLVR
jgi:hypothetical protein